MELLLDDFMRPNTVVQLGYPPNRVDLLTSISGVDFEEAWRSKLDGELDGLQVYFLGRDALLKNKRASGREKDLGDLSKLLAIGSKSEKS